MTLAAHPPSLIRRHAAIEADIDLELKRPLPNLMRVKRLKQQKLWIKDRLAAHSPDQQSRNPR
ncbi:MAG: YdcH family protein [Hyphomonadaceae bacterium]|nr:YdcH family protein [Hyphomonadaceae bacterium]